MICGVFRDGHPRITLEVPTLTDSLTVEFIFDTGFDGGMTLPERFVPLLDAVLEGTRVRRMADGSLRRFESYAIEADFGDDVTNVSVLIMEGRPLLGTEFIREKLISIEGKDGGDIDIEAL